jgi:hypothetical protein
MIRFFDGQQWVAMEAPTRDDVYAQLAAAASRVPCESCDAVVEMTPSEEGGPPTWVIHHEPDCRAA